MFLLKSPKRFVNLISYTKQGMRKMNQIQQSQFESQQAKLWLTCKLYALTKNMVLQITFNHMHYNGVDVINNFINNKKTIQEHFLQQSEAFPIDSKSLFISKIDTLPDQNYHFIGSPSIKPKQIIECFYTVWEKQFYIPIDMSHLDGTPCLLSYTFDRKLSFKENWNQVRRIKKNENNFLFNKDERGIPEWKRYVNPSKQWLSIMNNQDLQSAICFQRYSYDQEELQGLGIVINQNDSRWTFSFFADPTLMNLFISRYNLIRI